MGDDAIKIHTDWKDVLKPILEGKEGQKLKSFLKEERQNGNMYFPKGEAIFRAFNTTPLEKTKVVILGQDPYHGVNQANGLAFAVNDAIAYPPSLRNILKELQNDVGDGDMPKGNLEHWANQGVLLLNSVLTVRAGNPTSHKGKGWEYLTNAAISAINHKKNHVVFILWGGYAKEKGKHIDTIRHHIIESVHPSPLSAHRGFFGSKPFSKTNTYLEKTGQSPIQWAHKK